MMLDLFCQFGYHLSQERGSGEQSTADGCLDRIALHSALTVEEPLAHSWTYGGYEVTRVVTDSVSDLPSEVARELDIAVIPLNVHFGTETFRDGVDLDRGEFYRRLQTSPVLPKTSSPSPAVFAETFDRLAQKTNEILGIFLSKKLSTTYEVALQGIKLMKNKCHVVVVDSTLGAMGQGLLVMEAAKKALSGAGINELRDAALKTIPRVSVRATLGSLKYLVMGGRVGKAQALLASALGIVPILGIKDGEAFPITRLRSRAKASEWLHRFVTGCGHLKAVAVEYGSNINEATALAKRIALALPKVPLYLSQINPVIGTHTGPETLIVSVLSSEEPTA
jgi:DegV family protein with EDD domain